jgi:hypothetical protein
VGEAPYEVVVRLYAIADDYWPYIEARYYQIDLMEVSPTKFMNLIYAWCREVIHDQMEWERFEMELTEPIFDTKPSDATVDKEGEDFLAAMSTLQRG